MQWIMIALAPPLLGIFAAALLAPKNRGKKQPKASFLVRYPTRIRICAAATMLLMLAALAAAMLWGNDVVHQYAPFYIIYAVCIGLMLGLVAHLYTWYLEIDGDILRVHNLFGKPKELHASDIAVLNVQKYDVRVCAADGSLLFSVGIQLENLDLFFAWTHERKGIKVEMAGAGKRS
jgi:hypothetical protein